MPPASSRSLPPIPPLFTEKKNAILKGLAVPDETYTDQSPKGTVDAGIRELIDRINSLEGIVTTSSCAGRISSFLEGSKTDGLKPNGDGVKDEEGDATARTVVSSNDEQKDAKQAPVPGGKGKGGRWLMVSHRPIPLLRPDECLGGYMPMAESMFDLSPQQGDLKNLPDSRSRFVKFQFEPMILHIMTASLHHAQPVLSAAINAGFRESGVQSLKILDDTNSFPMVAIRTSGLALSSLIGFAITDDEDSYPGQALVDDDYLRILLQLANDRFETNAQRTKRFEENLFTKSERHDPEWEDPKARQERKRAEGLREKERLRCQPDPPF